MQIVFELALSFEWHGHAATNEWAIHKDKNTYVLSFLYQERWWTVASSSKKLTAFSDFLSRVAKGPMTEDVFNLLPEVFMHEECPVVLNTTQQQYLVLKMAARDPMAQDLVTDVLEKG